MLRGWDEGRRNMIFISLKFVERTHKIDCVNSVQV